MRRSESGFTLIEMLIVVGIIVAMAAAIVPQVVQFGGKGEEGKKDQEKATIQTAMDAMIADQGLSDVAANTGSGTPARNDWTTYPNDGPSGTAAKLSTGGYIRVTSTTWFYCWSTTGKIEKQTDAAADNCG